MLFLNGRVANAFHSDDWHWHVTLGINTKIGDTSSAFEYMVGPSLSGLEDRLFITAGIYVGTEQRLTGGYFVGDKVDTVTTIPTISKTIAKLGIGLSNCFTP